tara:strand:+ start:268 stop:927 length:660 start_codon:yes stop_codon:yes gene_type:complete
MAKIADQFKGLPMESLIGEPLLAAAKAQGQLANTTEKFIEDIGLQKVGDKLEARTVDFNYDVPIQREITLAEYNGSGPLSQASGAVPAGPAPDSNTTGSFVVHGVEKRSLQVPLLAIVNTPALSVKNVTVDFDMTVKTSTASTSELDTSTKLDVSYSAWWSPVKANLSASVASKSTNTRKSDNSARYTVHVEARDDGAPEGLMKVLDILGNTIEGTPSS